MSSIGNNYKGKLSIVIEDDKLCRDIFKALKPELEEAGFNFKYTDKKIIIIFSVNSISRLRAIYTSIIRLIILLNQLLCDII